MAGDDCLVVMGRRWLYRKYMDCADGEFFVWTPDEATRFPHFMAMDIVADYRRSFPDLSIYVALETTPFATYEPKLTRADDSDGDDDEGLAD